MVQRHGAHGDPGTVLFHADEPDRLDAVAPVPAEIVDLRFRKLDFVPEVEGDDHRLPLVVHVAEKHFPVADLAAVRVDLAVGELAESRIVVDAGIFVVGQGFGRECVVEYRKFRRSQGRGGQQRRRQKSFHDVVFLSLCLNGCARASRTEAVVEFSFPGMLVVGVDVF